MDTCLNINSERYYFKLYWDITKYDDGTKFVFCDELQDYTFHPYVGSLKEVPGYSEDRTAFENAQIFIIITETGKVMKVPCNIVEELKKVYINEGNFNRYWKLIAENLCRGVRKAKNDKAIAYTAMNEKVDLMLIENPSRSANINNKFKIEYKGREIDIETQRLISKRASAMEDNKIRFVYSKSDRLVHDKSCMYVEKIKYWDFGASEELPKDRQPCPNCKKMLYIRNAIKSDTKKFAWYKRFFEKGRVSNRVLGMFFAGSEIKLHMDSIDELIVKCKEDSWRIKMNGDGTYSLYHNNYVMVNKGERYITGGFHIQKHHPPYLPGILSYIKAYDWQKHLVARSMTESVQKIEENKEIIVKNKNDEKDTMFKRFIYWVNKSFNWKLKHCSKFCMTCRHFEVCKNEDTIL